jgi:hypothetical protein
VPALSGRGVSTERKRVYDRDRMMRLYYQGETWWQQHPNERWRYDYFGRIAGIDARANLEHDWRKTRPALPMTTEDIRAAAKERVQLTMGPKVEQLTRELQELLHAINEEET